MKKNLLIVFLLYTVIPFCQELKSGDIKIYSTSLNLYTNSDFENYFIKKCEIRFDYEEEREVYSFMKYIERLRNFEGYDYYITIFTNDEFRNSFISQLDSKLKNKGYLGKTLITFQNIQNDNRSVEDINKLEVDEYYGGEISAGEAYIFCDSNGLDAMIAPLKKKWVLEDNWEVPYLFNNQDKGQIYKIGQTISQKCGQDEVEILSEYISMLFSEDLLAQYEDQLLSKLYADTLNGLRTKYRKLQKDSLELVESLRKTKRSLNKKEYQSGWSAKIYPFVLNNGSIKSTVLNAEIPAKFKINTTSFAFRLDYVGIEKTKSKKNRHRKDALSFEDVIGFSFGYQQGAIKAIANQGINISYEIERDNYYDIIEINDLQEDLSLKFNSLSIGAFFQGKFSNINYKFRTDLPITISRSANYLVRNGLISYARRYNDSDFLIEDIPQHGLYNNISLSGMNGYLDSKLNIAWSVGGEIDYMFSDSRFGISGALNFFLIPVKLLGNDSSNFVSDEFGKYNSVFENGTLLKSPRLNLQCGIKYNF